MILRLKCGPVNAMRHTEEVSVIVFLPHVLCRDATGWVIDGKASQVLPSHWVIPAASAWVVLIILVRDDESKHMRCLVIDKITWHQRSRRQLVFLGKLPHRKHEATAGIYFTCDFQIVPDLVTLTENGKIKGNLFTASVNVVTCGECFKSWWMSMFWRNVTQKWRTLKLDGR